MLFASGTGRNTTSTPSGVPSSVRGLDRGAAVALIEAARRGAVAPAVQRMLVAQSGGNALALVELPHALSASSWRATRRCRGACR